MQDSFRIARMILTLSRGASPMVTQPARSGKQRSIRVGWILHFIKISWILYFIISLDLINLHIFLISYFIEFLLSWLNFVFHKKIAGFWMFIRLADFSSRLSEFIYIFYGFILHWFNIFNIQHIFISTAGALRIGSPWDFRPSIQPTIHLIAFDHLSLYIQKHFGRWGILWKGKSWQTKAYPGTAGYSWAHSGKARYS